MANEITVSGNVRIAKGHLAYERGISFRADLSGSQKSSVTQTIGTTYEALAIASDVASAGVAVFKNLDTTNYVEIGVVVSATFYPVIKLKAGEEWPVRIAALTLYAKANTAPVILEHTIFEN